jgi:hypothetical protein
MSRITLIRISQRVFVCGVLGFVPVLGIVPAIVALVGWFHARRSKEWNPAAGYLSWGSRLAVVSLGLSALAIGILAIQLSSLL